MSRWKHIKTNNLDKVCASHNVSIYCAECSPRNSTQFRSPRCDVSLFATLSHPSPRCRVVLIRKTHVYAGFVIIDKQKGEEKKSSMNWNEEMKWREKIDDSRHIQTEDVVENKHTRKLTKIKCRMSTLTRLLRTQHISHFLTHTLCVLYSVFATVQSTKAFDYSSFEDAMISTNKIPVQSHWFRFCLFSFFLRKFKRASMNLSCGQQNKKSLSIDCLMLLRIHQNVTKYSVCSWFLNETNWDACTQRKHVDTIGCTMTDGSRQTKDLTMELTDSTDGITLCFSSSLFWILLHLFFLPLLRCMMCAQTYIKRHNFKSTHATLPFLNGWAEYDELINQKWQSFWWSWKCVRLSNENHISMQRSSLAQKIDQS